MGSNLGALGSLTQTSWAALDKSLHPSCASVPPPQPTAGHSAAFLLHNICLACKLFRLEAVLRVNTASRACLSACLMRWQWDVPISRSAGWEKSTASLQGWFPPPHSGQFPLTLIRLDLYRLRNTCSSPKALRGVGVGWGEQSAASQLNPGGAAPVTGAVLCSHESKTIAPVSTGRGLLHLGRARGRLFKSC